jgi:hypothetical protein
VADDKIMGLILAYHGINDQIEKKYRWVEYRDRKYDLIKLRVSPHLFEKQLFYLKSHNYQTVSLEDLVKYKQRSLSLPKK